MKRYVFILLISILMVSMQQAIFSRIMLFNIGFDAVFIFVICFSLLSSEIECIIVALFCGILRDCFFPYVFGINCVIFLISAFILSLVAKRIYKDSIIIPVSLTVALSMLKTLTYFAYFYISSINFDFQRDVLKILVFESLLNGLLSIFIYKFVKKLNKLKIMQQNWKF